MSRLYSLVELGQEPISTTSPFEGEPSVCVYENFTCKAPVTDPKQLGKLLKL